MHSLRNGGFVNDRRFVLKLLFWKKQENKENIQNILGTCLISNSVFSVQFDSASGYNTVDDWKAQVFFSIWDALVLFEQGYWINQMSY